MTDESELVTQSVEGCKDFEPPGETRGFPPWCLFPTFWGLLRIRLQVKGAAHKGIM